MQKLCHDRFYDSPPPPQNQRLPWTSVSKLRGKRKDAMKKNMPSHTVLCLYILEDDQTMTSGGGRGRRISGDTAGSWFQNRRFSLKKSWGGYRSKTLGVHDHRHKRYVCARAV